MPLNLTRKHLRLSAKRYNKKKHFIKSRAIFAELSSTHFNKFTNSRFAINKTKKLVTTECADAQINNNINNNKNDQVEQISDCNSTDIAEERKILGLQIIQEHNYNKQTSQLDVLIESSTVDTLCQSNLNDEHASDPQNSIEANNIIEEIAITESSINKNAIEEHSVEPEDEKFPELLVEKQVTIDNSKECVDPGERSIMQSLYFINQMLSFFSSDAHKPFDCSADNMELTGQKHYGFRKTFFFKCNMCNKTFKAHTEPKVGEFLDVNTCMVAGVKSAGLNYTELEEITAYSGIKCLSDKTYEKISVTLDDNYAEIARNEIKKAGEEERKIAEESNRKEGDQYTCSVIVDGSWTMRCYGTQGRSETGAAVGIGHQTQKVLFYGYRNKYCTICARAAKKNKNPKKHRCYANWDKSKSSSSMESDIITEGFQNSIRDHNLMYTELIGDNDSSTYLKVLQANPYPTVFVKKINCVDHLRRNFIKKLLKILKQKTGAQGTGYKKIIAQNILRIVSGIMEAAKYRAAENCTFDEKEANLQLDIRNVANHVFGEHSKCANYFCTGQPKENEKNIVNDLKKLGLFDSITNILDENSYQAESYLYNKSSNRVESINSIINKKISGKRKSISQKGAYPGRLALPVVQFNTKRPASALNKFLGKKIPKTAINMENRRIAKNERNLKKLRENKEKGINEKKEIIYTDDEAEELETNPLQTQKRKQIKADGKEDYSEHCQKPDVSNEEFFKRVQRHYQLLSDKLDTLEELEFCTRGKDDSIRQTFVTERHFLMDRYFGEIRRMKQTTGGEPLIKKILFPSVRTMANRKYEEKGKISAKKSLEKDNNYCINECGL